MPTLGEWPENPSPSPASLHIAAIRTQMVLPRRIPNTLARGAGFRGRMRLRAAVA